VVHVEAGLRSFDRTMPEEINRVLTDQLADVLYTTERSAAANLQREGVAPERVHFVGNVMIDSLRACREHAVPPRMVLLRNGVEPSVLDADCGFGLVTLHRPSNVDRPESLMEALTTLKEISERLPLVCPLHPRTRGNIERFGLDGLVYTPRILILPPQGYLETLGLMSRRRW
jgi:UDP-N-acetylglucosamine 2-epimerase (non-hydrolysing)